MNMNPEDVFWYKICQTIIGAIVTLVCVVSLYWTNQHNRRMESIAKSTDPIATACAIEMESGDTYKPSKALLCMEKLRK